MKQEISSNELLEVQIKNNHKSLVNESLESTHTKGNLELAEAIGNLTAKIILPDGSFTATRFLKDNSKYICTIQAGNNDYSKTIIIILTPLNDDTYQYRITVLNSMREVA